MQLLCTPVEGSVEHHLNSLASPFSSFLTENTASTGCQNAFGCWNITYYWRHFLDSVACLQCCLRINGYLDIKAPSSYPLLVLSLFPCCFPVFSPALRVPSVLSVSPVCTGWSSAFPTPTLCLILLMHLHLISSSDHLAFNSGSLIHMLLVVHPCSYSVQTQLVFPPVTQEWHLLGPCSTSWSRSACAGCFICSCLPAWRLLPGYICSIYLFPVGHKSQQEELRVSTVSLHCDSAFWFSRD